MITWGGLFFCIGKRQMCYEKISLYLHSPTYVRIAKRMEIMSDICNEPYSKVLLFATVLEFITMHLMEEKFSH